MTLQRYAEQKLVCAHTTVCDHTGRELIHVDCASHVYPDGMGHSWVLSTDRWWGPG
jgi:hypothetical protein